MNIEIELRTKLPEDFSISYEELSDWNLGKYKPNPNQIEEVITFKIRGIKEVRIIYEDAKCIAGRFDIPVYEGSKLTKHNVDFMIAKHIFERTKPRCGYKFDLFDKLTKNQVESINHKVIDQIVSKSIEKLRQYNELLRQRNSKTNF